MAAVADGGTNLAAVGESEKPIPGLSFVDDSKLHHDFRTVKGNRMYFVDHCNYYSRNGARVENRIVALTSGALFIVEFTGAMDRATTYEHITDMYQKKSKEKGLLSFMLSEQHIVFKIPSEMDCHIAFSSSSVYQKFIGVLVKILEVKRGKVVVVKDIPPDKDAEFFCSDKRAEGYYTPREITEITQQRGFLDAYIRMGRKEVSELLDQIERAKVQASNREEEVNVLKNKGVDEESIRRRKATVEEEQMRLHRQISTKHEECERVLESIKSLQSELQNARANTDTLVEKGVLAMLADGNKKHDETVALRRRMQQKERANVEAEMAKLRTQLAAAAPKHGTKPAATNAAIDASLAELERELEAVFRLEKFLSTVNGEIEVQSDAINQFNGEKRALLVAREKGSALMPPATANPDAVSDLAGLLDDDDDADDDPLAAIASAADGANGRNGDKSNASTAPIVEGSTGVEDLL